MMILLLTIGTTTFEINFISHAFYFGNVIGSILISRIPDLYGRKWPFTLFLIAQLPCYIGLICSKNFILTAVLAFGIGVLNIGIYNGGYVNVCEYVHTPWKNHVCTVLLFFDNFTTILISLYFKYISRYWLWFQLAGIGLNIIAIIGMFFIPESPEYLYSFYRFNECREVIEYIAKFNGLKEEEQIYEFDVEVDLVQIRFEKEIAYNPDSYRSSIKKAN